MKRMVINIHGGESPSQVHILLGALPNNKETLFPGNMQKEYYSKVSINDQPGGLVIIYEDDKVKSFEWTENQINYSQYHDDELAEAAFKNNQTLFESVEEYYISQSYEKFFENKLDAEADKRYAIWTSNLTNKDYPDKHIVITMDGKEIECGTIHIHMN